jgi:hypothetical protein
MSEITPRDAQRVVEIFSCATDTRSQQRAAATPTGGVEPKHGGGT